ncbi:MAG: helix-turn-helix domain-containing protein, partial [Syntrophales bacterium]|nr:helix-turn-helix domain-containing protein [Syntrophales bacterium]
PGNIREMKNVIERIVIMSPQERIEIETIGDQILDGYEYASVLDREMLNEVSALRRGNAGSATVNGTLKEQMEFHEAAVIRNCLKEAETLKEAARILGIDTSTLVRKKQKYKI